MSDHGYKFYMQQVTKDGVAIGNAKSLEDDFDGMRYAKCEGINDYGKVNVYTETYADSDTLRTYIPNNFTNDATKITFTFYFIGGNRQSTYHSFVDFVQGQYIKYWDTARNRTFTFVVVDEIKPANELWHGSTPYLELKLSVQNLRGKTDAI